MDQQPTADEPTRSRSTLDDAELFEDPSFLLARANSISLAAGNTALAGFGLRVRSYAVLTLACRPTCATQRELSELLRLDPSQIVSLVDNLQSRGLVCRKTDPSDRRAKIVTATDLGREVRAAAALSARDAQASVFDRLPAEERSHFFELLRDIALPDGSDAH